MTQETKETLRKLEGKVKMWDKNGEPRYYVQGGYLVKAKVFFSETKQNARYHFQVPGGWFHAEKSYNGWTKKEIEALGFSGLTYDE